MFFQCSDNDTDKRVDKRPAYKYTFLLQCDRIISREGMANKN